MKRLALVAAVVALAAPAARADGEFFRYGQMSADAGYAGCVVTTAGARWCLVAERDATGARLFVASLDDLSVTATTTYPASVLATGTSLGRVTVRLLLDNALLGHVDVTFMAEATLTDLVTNDGCVPLPLHVELRAASATASVVYGTSGAFAGVHVAGYDRCGAAMTVGPASGLWRMTVA